MATIPDWSEKIKNAITFFAWEHERVVGESLAVTTLHRYLAFCDYGSSKRDGRPLVGLHSRRMGRTPNGPWKGQETGEDDSFLLIPQKGEYVVKAVREPDLGCFHPFELDEMKRLVRVSADRLARAHHEGDVMREETGAEAREATMNVSEVSFFTKCKEEGRMSGLILLTEKYTTQLKELEDKMADIKRKLETITEASRLLEEEGLLEDEARPRWP